MAFFDFLDAAKLPGLLPHYYAQFLAGLQQLDTMLQDGRPWLLGDDPGWADIACYTPVWMCRGNIRSAEELLAPLGRLVEWESRVAALGHGQRSEIDAAGSLAIARQSQSTVLVDVRADTYPSLAAGNRVSVTPEDYGRDAVFGELRRLTHEEIAIVREDERAGQVTVHFPRAGYLVEPA